MPFSRVHATAWYFMPSPQLPLFGKQDENSPTGIFEVSSRAGAAVGIVIAISLRFSSSYILKNFWVITDLWHQFGHVRIVLFKSLYSVTI